MSYGVNSPQGLQPYAYINGNLWSGQASQYLITSGYAQPIFSGDPVTLLADGSIGIGVAGAGIVGVFNGCIYTNTLGTQVYSPFWPAATVVMANTFINAQVIDDPNVLFNVQTVGISGIVVTTQNNNMNFGIGTGNTISGQSTSYADMTTAGTTATLNLKLLRLTPAVNNAYGVVFNNGLFLINNHILKGGTGTLGA